MTQHNTGDLQRLVVLSRDDYNRARFEFPKALTDPFTRVVAVPLRAPETEEPALLALGGALQPNSLLLRNKSGDDGYVEAAAAYELMSIAKFNAFASVCQMLSASLLRVDELRELASDGTVKGSADLKGATGKAGGTLNSDFSRRLAQRIKAEWAWEHDEPYNVGGGDPEAAAEFAAAQGISGDPVVAALIRQRRNQDNKLAYHSLELNISSEARRAIQGTLDVESIFRRLAPTFSATFDVLRKQSNDVVLRVLVDFRPPAAELSRMREGHAGFPN